MPLKYTHKKSVALLVFIGTFEVLDYLLSPITTYKSTPKRESCRLSLEIILKVSKFQKYQINYFAFSYSMMCILIYALCFIGNMFR